MKNKISHIKIKLLNIGFVFMIIGITISFIVIFKLYMQIELSQNHEITLF